MRKISIKNIKNLSKDGWQIDKDDEAKITRASKTIERKDRKDYNKQIINLFRQIAATSKRQQKLVESNASVSKSFMEFIEYFKNMHDQSDTKFEAMIVAQNQYLKDLINRPREKGKWEFDVKRNRRGFISKVYAKEL